MLVSKQYVIDFVSNVYWRFIGEQFGVCHAVTSRWLRFNPDNKRGLIIKKGTTLKLKNSSYHTFTLDYTLDFSSETLSPGTDYFIYVDNDLNFTLSTDNALTDTDKLKIGRFHTLCVDVGSSVTMIAAASPSSGLTTSDYYQIKPYREETDSDFYNFYRKQVVSVLAGTPYDVVTMAHPLQGFVAGDILPESVFCLTFYPEALFEDSMVYDKGSNKVIDIYLQSGTGLTTRSKYGATHTVSRQPVNHLYDFLYVGKRMLSDFEFSSAALGSNELTKIYGKADATTVGGHKDTASRRMVSAIGCEEMCGYIWQWLDELGPAGIYDENNTTDSGWAVRDGRGSFGYESCVPYQIGAGGAFDSGTDYVGSRTRSSNNARSRVAEACGSRGSSKIVNICSV